MRAPSACSCAALASSTTVIAPKQVA